MHKLVHLAILSESAVNGVRIEYDFEKEVLCLLLGHGGVAVLNNEPVWLLRCCELRQIPTTDAGGL
jgi:hypothetical protein